MAKKQDAAQNKLPRLLQQIKGAAALGKTNCEFADYEIDEYAKKLLRAEGFSVWATTKTGGDYKMQYFDRTSQSVWMVSW